MIEPILMTLVWMYEIVGHNLGVAIVLFTAISRFILLPLTIPALKTQEKLKELKPELDALKKKHTDAAEFQKAQLELYSRYNVNPISGCLPQLVQLGIFILLYQALNKFLHTSELYGVPISTVVWGVDLGKPVGDPVSTYALVVLVVATQFILSLMIAPGAEQPDIVPNTKKNKKQEKENEKEEEYAQMGQMMQQYMIFVLPLMTGFAAFSFPSGLTVYWIATTLFSIVQQWIIVGPGGLKLYYQRAIAYLYKNNNQAS